MVTDRKSVELDGVSQSLRSADSDDGPVYSFDIGRSWSFTVAYKPATVAGTQTIFHLNHIEPGRNDNTILLETRDDGVRVLIVGSKGYGYRSKMYDYSSLLATGTWSYTTVTWNSNSQVLSLYQDGSLRAPSSRVVDDRWVAMTDSVDKSLWIGENKDNFSREFQGRIHSAAIWNTVLSASRVATITGALSENLSDAQHWWRLGLDPTAGGLGSDYGSSATSIDVNQASSSIGASDIVTDFPALEGNGYSYSFDQYEVDFFVDAGSPASGSGDWTIFIDPGVTLGSSGTATPAAVTGVFPGTLKIVNEGRIQGKGGDGGYGQAFGSNHYGGGGGGAGTDPGTGGESGGTGATGSPGGDGTSEAGGAGGTVGNNPNAHNHFPGGSGAAGGIALQLDVDVTVDNAAGEIWGGGGGGGGGSFGGGPGGSGGDPGDAGSAGVGSFSGVGGAAGKAVDLQGNSITWEGGSGSPNVEGAVS